MRSQPPRSVSVSSSASSVPAARWIALALAGLLLVGPGPDADAAKKPPKLGNSRVHSMIEEPAQEVADVDDFREVLLAGERVQAVVRASKDSELQPTVELLGPTGSPEPVVKSTSEDKRTARFSRYRVEESGERSLLIAGASGTTGTYEAVTILLETTNKLREIVNLDATNTVLTHRFQGIEGATVTFVARWPSSGAPVRLAGIRDPNGQDVPVPDGKVVTTARTLEVRNVTLVGSPGEYQADFVADPVGAKTRVDLRSTVKSPERADPPEPVQLPAPEPRLTDLAQPVTALAGTNVTFTGVNFSFQTGLEIKVGGEVVPIHSSSATHAEVTVPATGTPGALVDVTVTNSDGQFDTNPAYFQFLVPTPPPPPPPPPPAPAPRLTDLTQPVTALAGTKVTFRGADFSYPTGLEIKVGGAVVPIHSSSATHAEVTVPATGTPGALADVTVTNSDGQFDTNTGYFQYLVPQAGGTIPTLEPGSGFTAATPAPAAVGTGPGSTSRAIARWDVVPYQTVSQTLDVGVVAFHVNGISHVSFSVQGGPWANATAMVTNTHTGADEYCARLDASKLTAGPIEIRAIAYPKVGVPRVLAGSITTGSVSNGNHSLFLNVAGTARDFSCWVDPVNGDDATARVDDPAKPARSMTRAGYVIEAANQAAGRGTNADGGTVYLKAGDHQYGTRGGAATVNRWLTFTRDPSTSRSAVKISVPAGTFYTKLARVHDVTLKPATGGSLLQSSAPRGDSIWLSNCDVQGPGRTVRTDIVGGYGIEYMTDLTIRDLWNGCRGTIVRNVSVERMTEDAFTNSFLVVNCSVVDTDSRQATGDPHADVYQFYSSASVALENRILYGLVATDRIWGQGIFSGQLTHGQIDTAIVGCSVANQTASQVGMVFQIMGPTKHMYVKDSSFVGPAQWRTDKGFTATDVVVENTWFKNRDGTVIKPGGQSTTTGMPNPGAVTGITYR